MKKNLTYESYFWLYTSLLQAVKFIGCLKKLKFRLLSLHWTQPRKRKEKVNLKERRRMPVKKIWNLREERPCAMSLRNCKWCRWVERWESENVLFIYFFGYAFTGQNSRILPVRLVFFPVRNKWGICIGLLVGTIYTDRTGMYGTESTSLLIT